MTLRAQLAGRLAFPLGFNLGRSKLWPGDQVHDGISFSAVTGKVVVKAPGAAPQIGSLTSLFTFTGGNQSMYVGPSGLLVQSATNTPRIEYAAGTVGQNFSQQSQTFDNAFWVKNNSTVSPNIVAAPDGSLTADAIVESVANAGHSIQSANFGNATLQTTISCYVKSNGRTRIRLRVVAASGSTICNYNLSAVTATPSAVSGNGTCTAGTITDASNGWYRITATGVPDSTTPTAPAFFLDLLDNAGTTPYTGDGASGVFAWGYQVEYAASASQYTPTTSTVPAYANASGTVFGLLMEASKTNLCLQSADFGTSWIVAGSTVSTNLTASPDGTTTADKLVEGAAGTFHLVRQDITIAANTPHTFSVFIAPAGRTFCRIQYSDTLESNGAFIDVNLTTGATGTLTTFGTGSAAAVTVTPYANGFYRIALRCTIDAASVTGRVQILTASALGTVNYSGDGTSGVHCWGAQLEAAQFASSYIPTTTVSVTRAGDGCIRIVGSEFNASTGSVVVTGRASPGQDATLGQLVWSIDDNTANERYGLTRPAAGDAARYIVVDGGIAQAALDATFVNLTNFKSAIAYALNDFAQSFNGAAVLTDPAGTLPSPTQVSLGGLGAGSQGNCWIKSFDYYPSRLTNAQLQQLSA